MKKHFFPFFFILSQSVFSQPGSLGQSPSSYSLNSVLTDLKGEPLLTGNAVYDDGSPFYFYEWSKGSVILSNGKIYSGILLKLNLQSDNVHYQIDETKTERVAGAGIIREVELKDPATHDTVLFRCNFPQIDKHDLKTFYQVLADGKAVLLKQMKRILIEEKAFNSATVTKRFDTEKSYYIFKADKMVRLKRTKSGVLEILNDQRVQLEKFISTNKLKFKSDSDLSKIVGYYNQL